jgi:sulfoxide reductase heme-binding subunit YedZ
MDTRFSRFVIFINSLVPLALLGWDAYFHHLGANPLEFATRTTGVLALLFLLLSLAVTPLRKVMGLPWMVKFRRMLGLYAFFYAGLHLLTYVWFDKFFDFTAIGQDILKRPFITMGMGAFLLLTPLAVTSTQGWIKRLGGKRWNRIHRAAYAAGAAGVIHYYMLVKADTREPLLFGLVLMLLLSYRVLNKYMPEVTERKPVRAKAVSHVSVAGSGKLSNS